MEEPLIEHAALRRRTVVSGFVAVVARSAQAVLSLGAAVVLARLLTPDDFGVFAMVVPLGILAGNFTNQCVQTAILQSHELSESDLSGFFRVVARANAAIALGMAAAGFAVAHFFDEPRVVGIAVVWAVLISLLTITTFQEALLKRELRFPIVYSIQLATLTLGLASSLIAAWQGAGYWALPIQVLVMESGRAVAVFAVSRWRPRLGYASRSGVGEISRSWSSLIGLRAATWLSLQPDVAAVGRLAGSVGLGLYDTARRWAWYPFEEPFLTLTDVAIASLRRVRGDADRFRRMMQRFIMVMLTASMPAIAFVVVEAESIVRVLLGTQWVEAVPLLRVLSVAAFAGSLTRVSQWVYLAHGMNGRLLKWSVFIQTPAILLGVLLGLQWKVQGIATAMAVVATALTLPAVAYGVRGTSLSFLDVIQASIRPAVASLLAAAAVAIGGAALPPRAGLRAAGGGTWDLLCCIPGCMDRDPRRRCGHASVGRRTPRSPTHGPPSPINGDFVVTATW